MATFVDSDDSLKDLKVMALQMTLILIRFGINVQTLVEVLFQIYLNMRMKCVMIKPGQNT